MFNLEKSLKISSFYNQNFAFFSSFFFQLIVIFIALELNRQEVPEIKFLQLNPSYYFFLIFFCIILFFGFNFFFTFFPAFLDSKKFLGTKIIKKSQYFIFSKFFYFLAFIFFFICLNCLIPSQFDNFYNYTEKTFENFWSFEEFFNLQNILFSILEIISESPILIFYLLSNNILVKKLLKSSKFLFFLIFLLSGIITPSVDVISQLFFAFFTIFFYFLSIHFLLKSISIKYLSLSNLS